MKNTSIKIPYAVIVCIFVFIITSCHQKKETLAKDEEETGAREAIERDNEMMKDPSLGTIPSERLLAAKEYKDQLMASQLMLDAPLTGVEWKELGPKNQGGRTRTILIDANDVTGNTVFAGNVGGGLWKTTNINAAEPMWVAVNNLLGNLAVSSIAQDPTNPQIMYMSTGEGYGNIDAIRGLGVWKSTNGGTTWNQLASTNNSSYYLCFKVFVNSTGILFVATSTGLYRSITGGTSFTKVLGTGLAITGAASNTAYDIEEAANGNIYASLSGSIHKSIDAGVTFGAAMTLPIASRRIELACAQSDANYVYAIIENGNVVNGIIRTVNAGTTWTSLTEPTDADTGIPATDFSRTQAWYDLSIAVDPNHRDSLYVGGVDVFRSTNGGSTWSQMTHWYGGFGFQYMHADQHLAFYKPGSSSIAYFSNDGGVFQTTNADAAMPTIVDKSSNYNTALFYSCAMHPTANTNYFLAGAQDNGSHQFNTGGINNTIQVTGGDGAFCHIDQDQPQFQFTSYVNNNYYRSSDGGGSFASAATTGGRFINPSDYDDLNNRLYAANGTNNYTRWDDPQTGSTFVTVTASTFGGQVTAVKVSPNTANRVFFGVNSKVFRVDNANTAAPTITSISTGLPTGAYLNCVEVQTGNDLHLLATYTNYGVVSIWESINGGTSWTSVEGNLPDMPIRWALFNPSNSSQAIVATELGVWSTDNLTGSTTVWGASNTGLANVRVDMLQVRQSDKLVTAATHGRGLFSSDIFTSATALFSVNKVIGYMGTTINFTSNSYKATAWNWDFGDGTTATIENPAHTYTTAGKYTVLLSINSGASAITKTALIHILPNKLSPYLIADGGGFETNINDFGRDSIAGTVWQKGNSAVVGKNGTHAGANAWVTGLTGNYLSNASCALYTPNYDFSVVDFYALKFWAKYNVELNYDGFRVEYSTNLGASWSALGTTVTTGWYNFANTSASSFPLNEAYFSANVPAYTMYGRDISFLAGNSNVAFRFIFKSDGNTEAAGVAIDDIEVTGPGNTWNGSVSDVWTNPLNWDGFIVPSINSNVIIPTIATNMPKLYASAEIKKLTLQTGASIDIQTGFVLKLNGQN